MRIPLPDQLNPGSIQGARMSVSKADMADPARAVMGLGRAVDGVAQEWKANQDKMDGYNASLAMEKWQTDTRLNYQKNLDGSAPDGSDFPQKQEDYLLKSYEATLKTIKNPEDQQRFQMLFERTRGNQVLSSIEDSRRKGESYVKATTGDSINEAIESNSITTNEEYDDYVANVVTPRVEQYITDPLERKKVLDVFTGQMRTEFVSRNPEVAMVRRKFQQPFVVADQAGRVSKGSIKGVNPQLMTAFGATQDAFGRSIPIVSGSRDAATNAAAGGAKHSQHLGGNAIDLDVSGLSHDERRRLIEIASANGVQGIGVYNNSLHFDLGNRRAWGPSHKRGSVPAWAASAIMRHENGVSRKMGGLPRNSNELWARLIQTESGGDQSAVSPKGAVGVAQVMPGTAPYAAKLAGLAWDETRYRTDAQYNEALGKAYLNQMFKEFDGDPIKALAAYNAGPGRTRETIAKHGSAWMQNMPAETQDYVKKITGGGPVAPVQYEFPPKPNGGIWEGMEQDEWQGYIGAGQKAFKESLDLGIERGEVTRDMIDMAPIDDGDKAMLLRRFDERNKDAVSMEDFVTRLSEGNINPKSTEDRKMTGKLFDAAGGGKAIAQGDPAAVGAMYDLYDKTGIVPDTAKGGIEAMLRSNDPARVNTALSYLGQFYDRNPRAFQQEFDEKTEAMVLDYKAGIDYTTPQQAADKVMKANDPAMESVRRERGKEADKVAAKLTIDNVKDKFDPSILPFNEPELTIAKDAEAQLMQEYRRLYVDAYKQTGDEDQAERIAAQQLTRVWGASEANRGMVMKWPPEALYGPMAMVNGSFDWMRDDVERGLSVRGYTRMVEKTIPSRGGGSQIQVPEVMPYYLLADSRTIAEHQAGKPASYQVWVVNEDGEYDIVPSRFAFDPKAARERAAPKLESERQENLRRQQQMDDELLRQEQEGVAPIPGGDPLIGTNPGAGLAPADLNERLGVQ